MRRPQFRHLAATSMVLTFFLILLGVYTGAAGAGLTCGARWPFCNGWLGLFPPDWPSFIEWFHRLVAMITGFVILGTAVAAYRGDHQRRIVLASAVAVLVLPVQILLGANTIWNFGLEAQILHHGAAQLIFGALVAATAWAYEGSDGSGGERTTSGADATARAD